jgi:hypothetical protein
MIYTHKSVNRVEGFQGNPLEESQAYDSYKLAVLRMLVQIKTPLMLRLVDSAGNKLKISTKNQTWDHLVLFESDLTAATPSKSEARPEHYQEWLGFLIREIQGGQVGHGGPRQRPQWKLPLRGRGPAPRSR